MLTLMLLPLSRGFIHNRYRLWCCGDRQHTRTGYRTGIAVVATKIKNKTTERYTFIEGTKGGILVYQSCILVLMRFPFSATNACTVFRTKRKVTNS